MEAAGNVKKDSTREDTRRQSAPSAVMNHVVHHVGVLAIVLTGVLLFIGICAGGAFGGSSALAALYNRGNRLYEEGEYDKAVEAYMELVGSGVSNGFLFYNLGNAHFKRGEIGRAILWYSRAQRIIPRDVDVATNLEFARKVRPDKIEVISRTVLVRGLRKILTSFSLSEIGLITSVLYFLTAFLIVLLMLTKRSNVRFLAGRLSLGFIILLLASLVWLGGRGYQEGRSEKCVILATQVDAMSGPGEEYTKVMSLHEGTEAQVEEEREGWYLIKLQDGNGAWVPAGAVEMI